jgi:hypothetical protein
MDMKAVIVSAALMTALGQSSSLVQAAGLELTVPATPKSSRIELAQMHAPVGHRQPTQNDIPPAVRQDEAPGAEVVPQFELRSGVRGG